MFRCVAPSSLMTPYFPIQIFRGAAPHFTSKKAAEAMASPAELLRNICRKMLNELAFFTFCIFLRINILQVPCGFMFTLFIYNCFPSDRLQLPELLAMSYNEDNNSIVSLPFLCCNLNYELYDSMKPLLHLH